MMKMMIKIIIPLAPVTKKNRAQPVYNAGGFKLVPSKPYQQYERQAAPFLINHTYGINYPVNVKATYYMKTLRLADLPNLHAALHDVLVKYGVLADDSIAIAASTDGSRVLKDKDSPRTEIEITAIADIMAANDVICGSIKTASGTMAKSDAILRGDVLDDIENLILLRKKIDDETELLRKQTETFKVPDKYK